MEFDEKQTEWSQKQSKEIPVIQTYKYKLAKQKAIELIKKKQYGLTQADFWILMNETKSGKMQYTTLILSHNGCLKINDNLQDKFKPESVEIIENGYKNELVFKYCNKEQGLFEVGEVSATNCKNDYPYAMALKRCFDRVILKLSKLAYVGIMSDSEAENMQKENQEEDIANNKIDDIKIKALNKAIKAYNISKEVVAIILSNYEYSKIEDIELKNYKSICEDLSLKK